MGLLSSELQADVRATSAEWQKLQQRKSPADLESIVKDLGGSSAGQQFAARLQCGALLSTEDSKRYADNLPEQLARGGMVNVLNHASLSFKVRMTFMHSHLARERRALQERKEYYKTEYAAARTALAAAETQQQQLQQQLVTAEEEKKQLQLKYEKVEGEKKQLKQSLKQVAEIHKGVLGGFGVAYSDAVVGLNKLTGVLERSGCVAGASRSRGHSHLKGRSHRRERSKSPQHQKRSQ